MGKREFLVIPLNETKNEESIIYKEKLLANYLFKEKKIAKWEKALF